MFLQDLKVIETEIELLSALFFLQPAKDLVSASSICEISFQGDDPDDTWLYELRREKKLDLRQVSTPIGCQVEDLHDWPDSLVPPPRRPTAHLI